MKPSLKYILIFLLTICSFEVAFAKESQFSLPNFLNSNNSGGKFDINQIEKSVVKIYAISRVKDKKGKWRLSGGHGSGFIVNKEGYIVTNWHVVANQYKFKDGRSGWKEHEKYIVALKGEKAPSWKDMYFNPDKYHVAELTYAGKRRDIAILKAEPLLGNPLIISASELEKGSPVHVIGYPGIADVFDTSTIEPTLTSGIVGRIYPTPRGGDLLYIVQHSAEINGGNSGGPLLDKCGRVVGINTWSPKQYIRKDLSLQTSDGVFYSSFASELLPVLKQKNVDVIIDEKICSPNNDALSSNNMVMFAIGGLIVILLIVIILKKPRQAVVQAMNRTSDTVFRRTPKKPSIKKNTGPVNSIQFTGSGAFSEYFMGVEAEEMRSMPAGLLIGKDKNKSTFAIDDDRISRVHARLFMEKGSFVIEDNGSTNGTFVNGRKITRATMLSTGDKLKIGPAEFSIVIS